MQEGQLKAPNGLLSKEDFLWLCHILENRLNCFLYEEKKKAQVSRVAMIKDETIGFENTKYIKQLSQDIKTLDSKVGVPKEKILKDAGCSDQIYTDSFESHIGDVESFGIYDPVQKKQDL